MLLMPSTPLAYPQVNRIFEPGCVRGQGIHAPRHLLALAVPVQMMAAAPCAAPTVVQVATLRFVAAAVRGFCLLAVDSRAARVIVAPALIAGATQRRRKSRSSWALCGGRRPTGADQRSGPGRARPQ